MKLIVRWLLLAAALLLVAYLYPGVTFISFAAATIVAVLVGLLNAVARPLLVQLKLPVTPLTLGLFLFVINAMVFGSAAGLLLGANHTGPRGGPIDLMDAVVLSLLYEGFNFTGYTAALIGSLIYSLSSVAIDLIVERVFARA